MPTAGSPVRRTPPKFPRPDPVPRGTSPTLARLADDPSPAAVSAFWDGPAASLPLVEDVGASGRLLVTFCWRDEEASQVLVFANRVTDEKRLGESMLSRIPGTDVWHVSFLLAPTWRASYCFFAVRPGERPPWLDDDDQVAIRAAFNRGHADPRNPAVCRNWVGSLQSVAALPEAPPQPWLAPRPGVERGPVVECEGPDGRRVWVRTPARHAPPSVLHIALDGQVWVRDDLLPTTLDNLEAEGLLPGVLSVCVDSGARLDRWSELAHSDRAVSWIADRLLPWVRAAWPTPSAPGQVVISGESLGGLNALRIALGRPDAVGAVVAQSASLWNDDLAAPVAALGAPGAPTPRVELHVGGHEWVLTGPHRDLAERLAAAGVPSRLTEYDGGHDYAWWRGGLADGLVRLFGPAPA